MVRSLWLGVAPLDVAGATRIRPSARSGEFVAARLYGILGAPMILYGGHLIMGARKVQARPGLFDWVRAVAVLVGW